MAVTLNWGLLGVAAISKAFVRGLSQSSRGRAVAVASRSFDKAQRFAADYGLPRAHGSYEALLADPEIDAVYIALPHPLHAEWTIKAVRAGKHVLCEKPFAVNHPQAMAVAEAVRESGRFVMEGFMYRCHPQTRRLVELIAKEKAIGEVRMIRACWSFSASYDANSRLFCNKLAGGGILDVGCYSVSIARLVAGAAVGKPFADPVEVTGLAEIGETGVDRWAAGTMKFPGGILARVATGIELTQDNALEVYGTRGRIAVPNPFVSNRANVDTGRILVYREGEPHPRQVIIEAGATSFAYEADAFAEGVEAGRAPHPAMTLADTLGNMKALDRWRQACGLTYSFETFDDFPRTTVSGETLAKKAGAPMTYGSIANVARPVSRLVMGVDNQPTLAHAAALFDDYFERGGNTFDTAHHYGAGGKYERLLGQWLKIRGVREQANVIVKGAHTPLCYPAVVGPQLRESLDRLQISSADIYLLHRDNPQVPAGEFVVALNDEIKAGRITGAIGASNWTIARFREANDYAAKNGLRGFDVLSNQFSLARMNQPAWPGTLSANDPESIAYLKESKVALLAWSALAHGYFAEHPADGDVGGYARNAFEGDDNGHRRARVNETAAHFGVPPSAVALAWVLARPFNAFAAIGPRTIEETRVATLALGLKLDEATQSFLDLTDEASAAYLDAVLGRRK